MYRDWIDEERDKRLHGINTPLSQFQHKQVNNRYPGCTLEYCVVCGEATGKAGKGEDSIYCDECNYGPFCEQCNEEHSH